MSETKSTYQLLKQVGPNFYRHSKNRTYYGRKKIGGKRMVKSLGPLSAPKQRKRLEKWLSDLESPKSQSSTTFESALTQFLRVRESKSHQTTIAERAIGGKN